MNRLDFMKELRKSLFDTVKAVYEPIIWDEIEKVENAADKALGITWYSLLKKDGCNEELELRFLDGKPVIVTNYGANMRAYEGICPVCSNIIQLTALYSKGKCLNCEKEYNFKLQTGNLQLEPLFLRIKDDIWQVGLKRKINKGDKDA